MEAEIRINQRKQQIEAEAQGVKVTTGAFGGESRARYEFAKSVAANTTFV